MEIFIGLATIIGGIVGVVQLIKWAKKPNINAQTKAPENRPYLDIEITYKGGSSLPLGISPNARPNPGQNYFIADETLNIWKLTKKLSFTLVNNSDIAALYPKLYIHRDSFKPKMNGLNSIAPIKPHEIVNLEAEYVEHEEKIPAERTKLEHFPSADLKDGLKVLVEYQDSKRKKYFTMFTGLDKKNEYFEKIPNGFE